MLNGNPIQVRHTCDGVLMPSTRIHVDPNCSQLTVLQGREECARDCDPTSCRWVWLCGYGVVAFHSLYLSQIYAAVTLGQTG